MKKVNFDIDIDMANRDDVLKIVKHYTASRVVDGKPTRHNTGVYFNEIPHDITGLSTINYKAAEERNYFKFDLLNLSLLDRVKNPEHLNKLMNTEPPWYRLQEEEFVKKLFHIHNHYDIVQKLKPDTIDKLAMVLAVIRPAKRHLVGKSWKEIAADVWIKPEDESYYFKHSHAIGYAVNVVINMNLENENDTAQ